MTALESTLCNLKDEVMDSGYFHVIYPYAELIEDGDKSYPAVYTGLGQYDQIYNFDVNGSGYFRKTGAVQSIPVTDSKFKVRSCGDEKLIDLSVPMRFVGVVPKEKLGDNSFSDDLLITELLTYINKRHSDITDIISIHGIVRACHTDRNEIWSQEVRGIERQSNITHVQVDLNLSMVAIDFYLVFRANADCLNLNCY